MDIHCFQVTASLEGLASVKALIISFGKIDWPNNGPSHQEEGLKEWEYPFHGIEKKMPSLRESRKSGTTTAILENLKSLSGHDVLGKK